MIVTGKQHIRLKSSTVLIADPIPFFRMGLLAMLRRFVPTPHVREADSVNAMRQALRQDSFDLVLLDLSFAQTESARLRDDLDAAGHPPLITFCDATSPALKSVAQSVGAAAIFSRTEQTQTVRMAVENVLGPSNTAPSLAMRDPSLDSDATTGLTERQREVHQLMLMGLPNKEIARRLGLSPNTVKVHMTIIFKKLGIASRYQALAPHSLL
jgi:DNA-binding NarL/FixJ family response regulator